MMIQFRRSHGDSPGDVQNDQPFPVQIMADVESRNVRVNPNTNPQVSVSTSVATQIVPYNPNRRSVLLTNLTGSQIVYLGLNNANGVPVIAAGTARTILTGAVGSNVTLYAKDAVWGLAATGAQTVCVWEEEYTVAAP